MSTIIGSLGDLTADEMSDDGLYVVRQLLAGEAENSDLSGATTDVEDGLVAVQLADGTSILIADDSFDGNRIDMGHEGVSDLLLLGSDNARVKGSSVDDTIGGNDGNNRINSGDGNDTVYGGSGDDTVIAGEGDDTVDGGSGNDFIRGGGGHDTLIGGTGNDKLLGDSGNDTVDGGSGNDFIRGGGGHDTLFGGAGNDKLFGDSGNDIINGGAGNDSVLLGSGNDTVSVGLGAGDDTVRGFGLGDILRVGDGASVANIDTSVRGGVLVNLSDGSSVFLKGSDGLLDQLNDADNDGDFTVS